MAAELGIEVGAKLHAKYDDDGEYYPAVVVATSESKTRAKKPVKVSYTGYDDEVWVSIASLKSKKLGLTADKPMAKAKVKSKDQKEVKNRDPVELTYFDLWAKGPGIAIALELSGIDWVGKFPEDWKATKPTTPFLELPILEVPGLGVIGHEAAIFNYIGKRSKKMEGYNMKDFLISQQLMQEGEDIYKRLQAIKSKILSEEQVTAFWNDLDTTTHNKDFGIKVFLDLLEKFYTKCDAGEGKYTKSGITVGECKLFTMLRACKLWHDDVLDGYAGVKSFYERFSKLEQVQAVIAGTGKMPGEFKKYFGA